MSSSRQKQGQLGLRQPSSAQGRKVKMVWLALCRPFGVVLTKEMHLSSRFICHRESQGWRAVFSERREELLATGEWSASRFGERGSVSQVVRQGHGVQWQPLHSRSATTLSTYVIMTATCTAVSKAQGGTAPWACKLHGCCDHTGHQCPPRDERGPPAFWTRKIEPALTRLPAACRSN